MKRIILMNIFTVVLAAALILSVQVFAAEITISGKINEMYQIVTEKGELYEVADNDLTSEVLENIGQTVKVTGTVIEDDSDVKTILVNDYEIIPASVAGAEEKYPHQVIDYLREKGLTVKSVSASRIAADLGDVRMTNVVMLGVLSTHLPIPDEVWQKSLNIRIPSQFRKENLQAFTTGQKLIDNA